MSPNRLKSNAVLCTIQETGPTVLAVAARGPIASWIQELLESEPEQVTPQMHLDATGDVALASRSSDHITVRVSGDARVLALRADGRAVWIERGVARFPARQVERLLMLTGIHPDQGDREELVAWLVAGASAEAIQRLWGGYLEDVLTLYGIDHQRHDLAESLIDPNEAHDLFDFLESNASLDERATPAVARREHGPVARPDLNPVEVGPAVFESVPVTTTLESGPPFRPVLFVHPGTRPCAPQQTGPDDATPTTRPRHASTPAPATPSPSLDAPSDGPPGQDPPDTDRTHGQNRSAPPMPSPEPATETSIEEDLPLDPREPAASEIQVKPEVEVEEPLPVRSTPVHDSGAPASVRTDAIPAAPPKPTASRRNLWVAIAGGSGVVGLLLALVAGLFLTL